MLVCSVARVQHRNIKPLRDEFRRAGRRVPDHNSVGPHGFERSNGIDERFAFFQARRFSLQRHRICASRAAAVVKLMRVRVDASKKATATVFPRNVANFFRG